ncbi:MAG: PEGA domain-containing protein [Deltaproteobacteria bacterium]|jgi:hypothetical protein|nr:PEGA domain-containing protein [Deltaproteobacteria bacterium]
MRWARFAVLAASLLSVSAPAAAQGEEAAARTPLGERWLVIPVRGAELDDDDEKRMRMEALHAAAESLRRELSARGEDVWSATRASERFEALGSAPAPEVSQGDIDRWVERSGAAVRYLARADYQAARRELRAAQRFATGAAEELNREAARARQVLDTCLFMVRAYVETRNAAEAHRQARECRQLVPRVEPTDFRHTPEVRALLAEVDAEIASEAPGSLDITSTPPGCLVRVNGVELGRTPLSGLELPVGNYRFQVECNEGVRGRIHRASIESGPGSLSVDAAFDRAVHTRPALYLSYDSTEAWDHRMGHAARVAEALGAAGVVAVSSLTAGEVRLDLHAIERAPASAWVAVREGMVDTEDLRRAFDALFEGRSVDFIGAHPIARGSWATRQGQRTAVVASSAALLESPEEPTPGVRRARARRVAGWSMLGAGAASIAASVGLHVWRGKLGDDFSAMPANLDAAQRWNDVRIGVWTTAAFGGAVTSAALPLLLPDYERGPWWGWAAGVLGLGLTGYAIYEGVTMTHCPEPFIADDAAASACAERGQEAGRVALALAGAAPLLTIPLVYLIQPLRVGPSVSVSGDGAVVKVRMAF